MKGPLNSSLVRRLNRGRLFHALREQPGLSRRELSERTGLDPSTVSNIIRELKAEKLITEKRRDEQRITGRPEIDLRLSDEAGVFIGIQLDMYFQTIIMTTLAGTPLEYSRLDSSTDLQEALGIAVRAAYDLLARRELSPAKLLGIGVGVGGLITKTGHLVVNAYQGYRWQDIDLSSLFGQHFSCNVRVDNDAKVAALAEKLFGCCRGRGNFLVLNGYAGIGGGLYLDDKILRGEQGLAGEVGHIKVVEGGRPCGCGGYGCLSSYASPTSILRILRENGLVVKNIEGVVKLAETGNPVVLATLEAAGTFMGRVLAILINTTNPMVTVIGGELTKLAPFLLPFIHEALKRETFQELLNAHQLLVSPLGELAVPLGGVGLAMEDFLSVPSWVSAL